MPSDHIDYNIDHDDCYGPLIGAIDEGTSSTRFIIFSSKTYEVVSVHQLPIKRYYPNPSWVEQDAMEIIDTINETIRVTIDQLKSEKNINVQKISAIGITNQRETLVLWDKTTGKPLYNAIVWLDTRTSGMINELAAEKGKDQFKEICGLPLNPYFSSGKYKWLVENVEEVRLAIQNHTCLFGTIDTWIIWNLTGGVNGGVHVTDVTNASCTMLMNINTLKWDQQLANFFGVPLEPLPEILSCSEIYGYIKSGPLNGIPISGCVGDQQAALIGQLCFEKGQTKSTYGTGCFLLCNTGEEAYISKHGLLTTVAYQFGKECKPTYALEGSISIAGACLSWLKNKLQIVDNYEDISKFANEVEDSNDVFFVPAFNGLYAPHWDSNARGVICGLTEDADRRHICRAALEAIAYQTKDVIDSILKDIGYELPLVKVDGGTVTSDLFVQLLADIIGTTIVRPEMREATALGAAIAAGIAEEVGVLNIKNIAADQTTFKSKITEEERNRKYQGWKKAVGRSLSWAED